ncbi:hypothetical protein P152DRAFT_458458 [Eremomyces bilateralis CBS 781.70]|uniref:Mitotic checkpoint regulator, MAD2B-interacting-domain-containing protein n=1 Tax=Eremomyces bilateralis CBS 781.70 TaxID=1392243 RepID=A0A6G1G3T5_9PEZI|nr:uncharacterized protein P152DRAFT_458458 [Eremomyces bilateralis CBS 781.70]KAF1812642.1 hypothetical protein P152DRAFT_458458 [Eremomyces bilateralis CBS 781.70]
MALVAYGSDSDVSDSETAAPTPSSIKPTPEPKTSKPSTKPSFKKVVDRSNPHKIRVDLPSLSQAPDEDTPEDGPPSKKPRIGDSGMGFNSFLPAPKNRAKPLGRGVSLKTGAEPAFSRESTMSQLPSRSDGTIPTAAHSDSQQVGSTTSEATASEASKEVKLVGKATMFRPLSVANKKKQKAKATTVAQARRAATNIQTAPTGREPGTGAVQETKPKKVSLFSFASEEAESSHVPDPVQDAGYTPLLYTESRPDGTVAEEVPEDLHNGSTTHQQANAPEGGPQSLNQIASDLNLSESARRQLFGRQKGKPGSSAAAASVLNFNTDQEYAANEVLRAAGETVQHNPVKAIAPGKHSLKQLVNAASSQREALEESFATNKRNKREAGGRYGW